MSWELLIPLILSSLVGIGFYTYWYIRYNMYWEHTIPHDARERDEIFTGKLIARTKGPYIYEEYRLYLTDEGFFILLKYIKNHGRVEWWRKFVDPIDATKAITLNTQFKRLFRKAARKLPEFRDIVDTPISHPLIDEIERETKKVGQVKKEPANKSERVHRAKILTL